MPLPSDASAQERVVSSDVALDPHAAAVAPEDVSVRLT